MKIIGVGLNKTGTKTLRQYFTEMGLAHQTYNLEMFHHFQKGDFERLLQFMEDYDSFEDWPWPLFYKEIDQHFDDTVFILTTRKNPEIWYKSLCKMAIRRGPFNDFEKYIYGYNMPHGRKKEHIDFYNKHNQEVLDYFKDRPHKLLQICWEDGSTAAEVAEFIGKPGLDFQEQHINKSKSVYSGDNLVLAHIHRVFYQTVLDLYLRFKKLKRKIR